MNDVFMNTYQRLPVSFVRGKGVRLIGDDGKSYLDFTSGIGVNCLGHNYPPLVEAIEAQAQALIHVSNYYQSNVSARFAQKLCAASGLNKVFFCNSGAEANEGAIKLARKYSLKKYGEGRHTIVTLRGSFHGRTITTVSATGQSKFHKDFGPFTEGFTFIPPNDRAALETALDEKSIAALLLEPILGESGVIPLETEYLRRAAELCAKKDILLIFDEIQTGAGRTGKFLASAHADVKADIVTMAKGIAGGIPAGVVLVGEKAADTFEKGDHGSTFGGNALAAAAGIVVLETLETPGFLDSISEKGEYLMDRLRRLSPQITVVRGKGLMVAADIRAGARTVLENLIARAGTETCGVLVLQAGPNTLRFLPPYTITQAEIGEGLDILAFELARLP